MSATETLGDTSALAAMGFNREAKDREISGSIAVDGFVSAVSSLFGCLPITSFSQNVGLIAMTRVVNRKAIASGAVIMVLAGLVPALGVILASLPEAVLGGCTLMMFGSIVMSGVQMISRCGYSQRNMSIAALSLSIGLGFTQTPQIFRIFPELLRSVFAENCVAVVFIVAVLLNLVFPKGEEEKQRQELPNEIQALTDMRRFPKVRFYSSEKSLEFLYAINIYFPFLRTRFAYNGPPVCFFMSISYTVAGKLYIVLIRCRHRNE